MSVRVASASQSFKESLFCPIDRETLSCPEFLGCGHVFNPDAIKGWMKGLAHDTCPECRAKSDTVFHSRELSILTECALSSEVVNKNEEGLSGAEASAEPDTSKVFPITCGRLGLGDLTTISSAAPSIKIQHFDVKVPGITSMSMKIKGSLQMILTLTLHKGLVDSLVDFARDKGMSYKHVIGKGSKDDQLVFFDLDVVCFFNELSKTCQLTHSDRIKKLLNRFEEHEYQDLSEDACVQTYCLHLIRSVKPAQGPPPKAGEIQVSHVVCPSCENGGSSIKVPMLTSILSGLKDANKKLKEELQKREVQVEFSSNAPEFNEDDYKRVVSELDAKRAELYPPTVTEQVVSEFQALTQGFLEELSSQQRNVPEELMGQNPEEMRSNLNTMFAILVAANQLRQLPFLLAAHGLNGAEAPGLAGRAQNLGSGSDANSTADQDPNGSLDRTG